MFTPPRRKEKSRRTVGRKRNAFPKDPRIFIVALIALMFMLGQWHPETIHIHF